MNTRQKINRIAKDYFHYMARNYPVMCLSDEFYFFPRVKESIKYLNILDSLDEQKIKQNISYVKRLLSDLEVIHCANCDIEVQIDFTILKQNIVTFLREFEENKIYEIDPTLYLKILVLGIEHTTSRISTIKDNIDTVLINRIKQVPRILNEAKVNLKKIPSLYQEVAFEMVDLLIEYFKNHVSNLLKNKPSLINDAILSLQDFKRFLKSKSSYKTLTRTRELMTNILKGSYSYERSLDEIYEIAVKEYRYTLGELKAAAKKDNWRKILSKHTLGIKNFKSLLRLYSEEIKRLKDFFIEKDIITIPKTQNIIVKETPSFMMPIRASASYSCPLSKNIKEPAFFYLTEDKSIYSEYIFLTAHETYPGHHLLDTIRRFSKNPIRQQIESPFFYEGWASYAEKLVDSLGYINTDIQRLVGLKRQAWRAVRAMLDVGIVINKLKIAKAEEMLEELGYSHKAVKQMIRHYTLTPGYQLCYTVGKFELERLRNKFAETIGLKRFHDVVLDSGQAPFNLIEKRIELICKKTL